MAQFTDSFFPSCDGKHQIHVRRCAPVGPARGVVQLTHGIAEHVERYDAFAAFLADRGFLVVADDHLGHGQSAGQEEDLGYTAEEGGWELMVGDMRKLYEATSAEFPGLPYFLFGHSMGSFLARTYIIRYPRGLSGAIICGTGQQAAPVVAAGLAMARLDIARHGGKNHSAFLNKAAFGSYNKGFEPKRTDYDWLTRDEAVVDAYLADPRCGFSGTSTLFRDMMSGIQFIGKKRNLGRMNKDLPVFFISGDKDPVGENGKGVLRAYKAFLAAGMKDVTLKLYPDARHEILNELDRETTYADVLSWLEAHME